LRIVVIGIFLPVVSETRSIKLLLKSGDPTEILIHSQWRMECIAGMAFAIGDTLTGAQKLLGKI